MVKELLNLEWYIGFLRMSFESKGQEYHRKSQDLYVVFFNLLKLQVLSST